MTAAIFHSWPALFESVTFDELQEALLGCVDQLLEDFKDSVPAGLEDRAASNGKLCCDMVKTILPQVFSNAKEVLVREQKKLTRSLDDHVADQLHDAYVNAAAQTGKGSVRRQKVSLLCSLPEYQYLAVALTIFVAPENDEGPPGQEQSTDF
jgi:hypothetical protein